MSSTFCSVCGDLATSYCHYGASVGVCHSCRTFFRRTSMVVSRGKMKRALFCCLRGGKCTVDVNTRKKCNFCRFEKCKVKGMVYDFKEPETKLKKHVTNTKIVSDGGKSDKFELCVRNEHLNVEPFLENKTFMDFPKTLSFKFGQDELGRFRFFVELYRVQKIVEPIGLPIILPIVECSNYRKPFPKNVVRSFIQIHEHWWSQFCNGLEEFQDLNHEEKKIVLKNVPLVDRLCQGLYIGPGAGQNLLSMIKGMTSDRAELEVIERYLKESNISSTATWEYKQWRSSPWNKNPEHEQIHQDLCREIVTWGQKGLDDVSELLVCLLILFRQEEGGQFSKKIAQLCESWRVSLWRYLESQDQLKDTKHELFKGALGMVEITQQIWRIDQNCL